MSLLSELGNFAVPLLLIWLLINAPSLLQIEPITSEPMAEHEEATEAPSPTSAENEFWARLPGRMGRELIAFSAELHYLRVFTTKGDALILFPFGRAVEALQSENGMQVHRSHWVALPQIDELITKDGRLMCKMINGPSLPVSRSYRAALRAKWRKAGA